VVEDLWKPSELMSSGGLLANKTILCLHLQISFCLGFEGRCNVDGKPTLVNLKGRNEKKEGWGPRSRRIGNEEKFERS
jgi:hypothetical protein